MNNILNYNDYINNNINENFTTSMVSNNPNYEMFDNHEDIPYELKQIKPISFNFNELKKISLFLGEFKYLLSKKTKQRITIKKNIRNTIFDFDQYRIDIIFSKGESTGNNIKYYMYVEIIQKNNKNIIKNEESYYYVCDDLESCFYIIDLYNKIK